MGKGQSIFEEGFRENCDHRCQAYDGFEPLPSDHRQQCLARSQGGARYRSANSVLYLSNGPRYPHSILATQEAKIKAVVNTIVEDQAHTIKETIREELGIIRQEQNAFASQQIVVAQAFQIGQIETISNVVKAALSELAAGLDSQIATTIDRALGQLLSRLSIERNEGESRTNLQDVIPSTNEASPADTMADAELESSIKSLVGALSGKQGNILLDDRIQMLGRWSSEAFRVYLTTNPSVLYRLNHQFQTGSPPMLSLATRPPSPPPP